MIRTRLTTPNGHRADFYHDPDRNGLSNANDSWLQVCNYTSLPGWAGGATGWTGTKNNCIHQFEFNSAPGFSLGTPAVGPGGWSTHDGINITSVVNSTRNLRDGGRHPDKGRHRR